MWHLQPLVQTLLLVLAALISGSILTALQFPAVLSSPAAALAFAIVTTFSLGTIAAITGDQLAPLPMYALFLVSPLQCTFTPPKDYNSRASVAVHPLHAAHFVARLRGAGFIHDRHPHHLQDWRQSRIRARFVNGESVIHLHSAWSPHNCSPHTGDRISFHMIGAHDCAGWRHSQKGITTDQGAQLIWERVLL